MRGATPIAFISVLPFTSSPCRAAKVRERTPVSAKAISAIPAAGPIRCPTSCQVTPPREGKSFRQCADHADVIGETGGGGQDYCRDDGDQHTGYNRYPEPEDHNDNERTHADDGSEGIDISTGQSLSDLTDFTEEAGRVDGETEQLGNLTDYDDERDGVEVAEADRFREEFGHETQTQESADHQDEPDKNGENSG